jgi:hypothetical protein
MKNHSFIKYYRVYKNDTAVTEVSVNDFKSVMPGRFRANLAAKGPRDVMCSIPLYYLPSDENMFYGYLDKAVAMEKAKAGALAYINQMVKEVEKGIKKLEQYRDDHYHDLNINLLDANINRIKKQMNIK